MKLNIDTTGLNGRLVMWMLIVSLTVFSSCEDNETEIINIVKLGKREYIWSVDTLKFNGSLQTNIRHLYANSATDIYVVGHNDQNKGQMYHFDGLRWKSVGLSIIEGGAISGSFDLAAVYGFSSSDIWAVGEKIYTNQSPPPNYLDSSLILHFDGIKWSEFVHQRGRALRAIWGSRPDNIWVVGQDGTVFCYNGISWQKKIIRDNVSFYSITGDSTTSIFVLGYKLDTPPYDSIITYNYNFDGATWVLQDSIVSLQGPSGQLFGGSNIWELNSKEVYSVGDGVYKKNGSNWNKLFDDGDIFSGIRGNASNNIFAVGLRSRIYHYNGINWYKYTQFQNPSIDILDVWANGSDVFAVANDGYNSFIFHGK